jgi:choline dehydrogenase-like flavoprotein
MLQWTSWYWSAAKPVSVGTPVLYQNFADMKDPCGTARLSKSIDEGVVDSQLKVHGIKNLRVIDASVFPVIPDCRIQNAVYMVGEEGADLIKAEYPSLY